MRRSLSAIFTVPARENSPSYENENYLIYMLFVPFVLYRFVPRDLKVICTVQITDDQKRK